MLKIETRNKNEHEADVYINDKLFADISCFPESDYFFCHNLTDFHFLSKFSFQELALNKVGSIIHNLRNVESNSCFFSYTIHTSYVDPDYLKYSEENPPIFEDFINQTHEYVSKDNYVSASLNFKYSEWKKLYSINEFQIFLHKLVLSNLYLELNTNIYFADPEPYDQLEALTIEFRNLKELDSPSTYLESLMPILKDLIQEAITKLDSQHSLDIYSTYFNFPEEYKTSCKQYLMYFAQFLLDLGISVNTELKDTKEGTFFSVIPEDKNQAIENIKELLVEYLNAPNMIDNTSLTLNTSDIAAIQFQANLFHLKSQLAFANTQIELKQAIIQSKEASIQSLNLSNYQLSEKIQILSKKDEESIVKGVVSVTQFEKSGIKINLPELLRKLKRKLQ